MASRVLRAAAKVARLHHVLPASQRAASSSGGIMRGTVGMTPFSRINRRLSSSATSYTKNARARHYRVTISCDAIILIAVGGSITYVGQMLMRNNKAIAAPETNDTYICITKDRVDFGEIQSTQGNGTEFTLMNERGDVLAFTHQYDQQANNTFTIGDGIRQNRRVKIVTDKPLYIHQKY